MDDKICVAGGIKHEFKVKFKVRLCLRLALPVGFPFFSRSKCQGMVSGMIRGWNLWCGLFIYLFVVWVIAVHAGIQEFQVFQEWLRKDTLSPTPGSAQENPGMLKVGRGLEFHPQIHAGTTSPSSRTHWDSGWKRIS